MISEYKLRVISTSIEHGKVQEGAIFYLLQCVPCILHMENRIGLKMFSLLLRDGLDNALAGLLYEDLPISSSNLIFCHFINDIEKVVNTKIFGDEFNQTQWSIPRDVNAKEILEITLDNNHTRSLIESFDSLVVFCIKDAVKNDLWKKATSSYTKAMEMIRKKEDFTDLEINLMQQHLNEFFQV